MGLDIIAYRRLAGPIISNDADTGCYTALNDAGFESRGEGIQAGATYSGCDEELHFRAGSYSGYAEWREQLAKLAGYPSVADATEPVPQSKHGHTHSAGAWGMTEGPFWELINFSDCEGTIGPKVAAKLLRDFIEYQSVIDVQAEPWFQSLYFEWRRAFEMAADHGAVVFC
jgi:hypothetical protein